MTEKPKDSAEATGPPRGAGPTTRRRQLGFRLLELRKAAGLSAEEAGVKAGMSKATVSRYETGKSNVRWNQVDALCRAYNSSDSEREALVELAKNSRVTEGWWVPRAGNMPNALSMLIALENEAERIDQFASSVVPGLLQTREYAQAIKATPGYGLSREEVVSFLDTRIQRQTLFDRPAPPTYRVVLDESVIRRSVGGPAVMAGQLEYLLKRLDTPNVTIQVLPFERGVHSAALTGIMILGSADPSLDVIYTESISGSLYLEEQEERLLCTTSFEYLLTEALSPDASTEMIAEARNAHLRN
ncbi:helix-turn-helix domain-containing protein [Streptomyces sp. NPDC001840]